MNSFYDTLKMYTTGKYELSDILSLYFDTHDKSNKINSNDSNILTDIVNNHFETLTLWADDLHITEDELVDLLDGNLHKKVVMKIIDYHHGFISTAVYLNRDILFINWLTA